MARSDNLLVTVSVRVIPRAVKEPDRLDVFGVGESVTVELVKGLDETPPQFERRVLQAVRRVAR